MITDFHDNLLNHSHPSDSYDHSQESTSNGIWRIAKLIPEAFEKIVKSASHGSGISGIPSGFDSLDQLTAGWQNGELIAIGGRPGMGKTAFILSMLKRITVDNHIPAMLFSLEMNEYQIANRLLSCVCKIPCEKLKKGLLAPYEWGQLDYKIKELNDAPLYLDTAAALTIEELCQKAQNAVKEYGVGLIVIDYLQLLYQKIPYSESRYTELNYFTRRLKSLAKELNIPIIITSQLNRETERRGGLNGGRPQLSDLRDSGTICDDCDMVCFIHRPEYYHIYQDEQGYDLHGVAEFQIAKQRNGTLGKILLHFREEYACFYPIEQQKEMKQAVRPSRISPSEQPPFNFPIPDAPF